VRRIDRDGETGNQDRRSRRQRPLLQLLGVGSVSSWHAVELA